MNPAPAQLTFVSSLFTSKIFWAQIVSLAALVLSASGVHVIDAPGVQEQLIGGLDMLATIMLRLWFPTGPVSLTGPLSTPAAQNIPAGASVVSVPAPKDAVQVAAVQALPVGSHTVDVAPPPPSIPPPVSVTVTPATTA
jgi:hypothetical protein